MESLSKWQKLRAKRMPIAELRTVPVSIFGCRVWLSVFIMIPILKQKALPPFGSRAGEIQFGLFSFALLAGPPLQRGNRVFNDVYAGLRKRRNHGRKRQIGVRSQRG